MQTSPITTLEELNSCARDYLDTLDLSPQESRAILSGAIVVPFTALYPTEVPDTGPYHVTVPVPTSSSTAMTSTVVMYTPDEGLSSLRFREALSRLSLVAAIAKKIEAREAIKAAEDMKLIDDIQTSIVVQAAQLSTTEAFHAATLILGYQQEIEELRKLVRPSE